MGYLDPLKKVKLEFINDLQKDVWRIALNPKKTKLKNQAPQGEGVAIEVGDIIKVGRIKFKVREMKR
jgi:hypothetical protein